MWREWAVTVKVGGFSGDRLVSVKTSHASCGGLFIFLKLSCVYMSTVGVRGHCGSQRTMHRGQLSPAVV